MSMDANVTMHLKAFREGDQAALDLIIPLLYQDLKRLANGQLRRGAPARTLGATGLVNELYLKLLNQEGLDAKDRGHFLAISARAMRQVLADAARKRSAAKRGGGQAAVTFEEDMALADEDALWLTDLDDALVRLAEVNERLARVVECRFFAGLSEPETAEALDTSLRTVQRDWMRARAWLQEELGAVPPVSDT